MKYTKEIKNTINALRFLSIDAIENANSGHPGMPMGMAEIAYILWQHHLKHTPKHKDWPSRDRFVLSNGHGSMLLYSLLHLSGYDLSLDDLKNFRKIHSKTPGHPELGVTPGVETTTGPLGQGLGSAVGMALAEKLLANKFNLPSFPIVDNYTYVFAGDGCFMEGISHEVSSLAGLWRLGKLIVFYDSNQISIDGDTKNWLGEDITKRFSSYNWQVIGPIDGHNLALINSSLDKAKAEKNKPSIIICKTTIAKGAANKEGLAATHGSPLGQNEVLATRQNLDWPYSSFEIPKKIKKVWNATQKGEKLYQEWINLFSEYEKHYPELASEYKRRVNNELPSDWLNFKDSVLDQINQKKQSIATRKSSSEVINILSEKLPEFLGGSADLTPSNLTNWPSAKNFVEPFKIGNYIHYGVREFGMSSIMNGVSTYGGFVPFGGTFLTFCDYSKPAIRLSALMRKRVIYIFTHDSIGLGEDGPTHQPIEHASALRMIPGLDVWRPCDSLETAVAWFSSLSSPTHPTAMLLSRQNLVFCERGQKEIVNIEKGGYVLKDQVDFELIFLATGSEVGLAISAQTELSKKGIKTRVVSMPSVFTFEKQSADYRNSVLPSEIPVLAIEAASSSYWYKFTGSQGKVLGLDTFGESGAAKDLFEHFGFNLANVIKMAQGLLKK